MWGVPPEWVQYPSFSGEQNISLSTPYISIFRNYLRFRRFYSLFCEILNPYLPSYGAYPQKLSNMNLHIRTFSASCPKKYLCKFWFWYLNRQTDMARSSPLSIAKKKRTTLPHPSPWHLTFKNLQFFLYVQKSTQLYFDTIFPWQFRFYRFTILWLLRV